MGKDDITDLLALSFSSTDYIGHQFGAHSVEVHDMYVRLDRELAEFFEYIDKTIGIKNTLFFLTADHGAADIPGYIMPPAGYFKSSVFEKGLRKHLTEKFGSDPIEYFINQQLYLKKPTTSDFDQVIAEINNYAEGFDGVHSIVSLRNFNTCMADPDACLKLRKGVMPSRSGDVFVQLFAGWLGDYNEKGGTTHGSTYNYDTHVPIIFFGWKVKAKNNYDKVWIEDIAPTVSNLLHISRPSGSTGQIINVAD